MAYHSDVVCDVQFGSCDMAKCPLKNTSGARGNAPVCRDEKDIIDDILYYYKPNVFFSTYDIENPVDRTYVYGTLYLAECLKVCGNCKTEKEAGKQLYTMAVSNFDLPGDTGFPLNQFFKAPSGRDSGELKTYLTQFRQELGQRLIAKVYDGQNGDGPSKWWICFNKNGRTFMNKTLVAPGRRY